MDSNDIFGLNVLSTPGSRLAEDERMKRGEELVTPRETPAKGDLMYGDGKGGASSDPANVSIEGVAKASFGHCYILPISERLDVPGTSGVFSFLNFYEGVVNMIRDCGSKRRPCLQ